MDDVFISVLDRPRLVMAGVAITTKVCRAARRAHALAPTSCVALGRLLTAAALAGLIEKRGGLSLQLICDGQIGQMFVDITETGDLRGFVKNPTIDFPLAPDEDPRGRHRIGHAVGRGSLSVIRLGDDLEYAQSTTKLVSGEVDADVAHFLEHSDQISTAMVCDVLLDEGQEIDLAGGILVQEMPGADPDAVESIKRKLAKLDFARALRADPPDLVALARKILPRARGAGDEVPLQWKCRCSYGRVARALKMMDPGELAKLVDERQPATVHCDFCAKTYEVAPEEIEKAFLETITARG